jgi:hypothetical protein
MITKGKESKVQNQSDDQGLKVLRTAEMAKEWSSGAEQSERLLNRIRIELSLSRVAGDFHPSVVHHLRNLETHMIVIKKEVQWIETRLKETLVVEREWWKK